MRLLLDECVNADLKGYLFGHEVKTVTEAGWAGKRNGELLGLVSERFDAFITVDRNLSYQQNLSRLSFPVVLMVPDGPRFESLQRLVPALLAKIETAPPGQLTVIDSEESA